MQNIFVEKPYEFVPAFKTRWPQRLYTRLGLHRRQLRKREGVHSFEVLNADRLRTSIADGHGILLTPNHSRMADPGVMCEVSLAARSAVFTMASWHLFNQGGMVRTMIRMMGAFSVNREGMDRQAIDYAVNILQTAQRPLILFPEGTVSRTNDRLMAFMDGPSFIARTAAKRRAKDAEQNKKTAGSGKVVVHPIAIKYTYQGDIERAASNVLTDIEKRLSWRPQAELPLVDRLIKVGDALLKVKELQYECNVANNGNGSSHATLRERQNAMIDHLLGPLEEEWLGSRQTGGIQIRVKNLRVKIFPAMSRNELDVSERRRRWEHLEKTYLAQQIDCYPENYVLECPTVDRILETVEKFEEDFNEVCRIHGEIKATINVGEAVEVPTRREKSPDGDPLMLKIRSRIEEMLGEMQDMSQMYSSKQPTAVS